MEFEAQHNVDALMAGADQGRKKRGSTFLKMFRFDKARTPKNAIDETNHNSQQDSTIDYANYLIEIQEGKKHILKGLRDRDSQKTKLIKGNVQRETVDIYDLRASGVQSAVEQITQPHIEQPQKIPQDFNAKKENTQEIKKEVYIKKSLSYQVSSGLKEEIYEMIFSKTADQATLRKWVEGWLP